MVSDTPPPDTTEHESGSPADQDAARPPLAEQPARGLSGVASSVVGAAGAGVSAARRPVDQFADGARRALGERSGARVRKVRTMGRRPLANLWEEHPEARRAAPRELGLQIVPVEQIVGTAVEGAAQRGGDFLPLRDRRGADWRARWQRIRDAHERLVSLPPVDLLKLGDEFWVVDGHNRLAAALYGGQQAVDASVTELRLPGEHADRPSAAIAPYLEGSDDVRAAGAGRLSRTASRPTSVPSRIASDIPPGEAAEPDAE